MKAFLIGLFVLWQAQSFAGEQTQNKMKLCQGFTSLALCRTSLDNDLELKLATVNKMTSDSDMEAISNIIDSHPGQDERFTRLLNVANVKGIPAAQYRLAVHRAYGDSAEISISPSESAKLLEKVVSQKAPNKYKTQSHEQLALLYSNGPLKKNPKASFTHFKACAEGGSALCMANTGMNYMSGYGTREDMKQAGFWILKAQKAVTKKTPFETIEMITQVSASYLSYAESMKANEQMMAEFNALVRGTKSQDVTQRSPAGR